MHHLKGLFHKEVPPEELVKEWRQQMRHEGHVIDREIRQLERMEDNIKREVKKLAKLGEVESAKMLARELVASKKAKGRMYEAKARINSVARQLSEQLATLRMTKAMQMSGEAMQAMNELVSVPQVSATMREMGKQMEKAGFIQELVDDTLHEEGLDDEADAEVDRVFEELTAELNLPTAQQGGVAEAAPGQQVGARTGVALGN